MPLLRVLGVWFGVAIVLGGTIGAGILRTPGLVMAHVGSPALAIMVWVIAGLFAMAAAACLAELAAAVPKSGGFYVFAQRALGDGWTKYGPTAGLPELRASIAAYISRTRGVTVGAENVCVVPRSS